ncbi:hypothetical protein SEVIR_1G288900v4 [Setaria viridis]
MAAAAAAAAKAAAAAISAGAAVALCTERAHAEGGGSMFRFPGFSTPSPSPSPSPAAPPPNQQPPAPADGRGEEAAEEVPRVSTQHARTSAAGFDPAPLERGVRALDRLGQSPDPKKLFELMKKQEETRQQELAAKKVEEQRQLAQLEIEKKRIDYEETKKLDQQRAKMKAQSAQYEDDLKRKRLQAEHEAQRVRNQELVKMQEESAIRLEQIRRATEEQIQEQRRQTEKERSDIVRETIKLKAMSEAQARILETKETEDVKRRLLVDQIKADREKWIEVINTTFEHIGGGLQTILTDQNKLVVAVGGLTALAAGIYTTREGARVVWGYVDRILGQPSLVRESSRGRYPWSGSLSRATSSLTSKLKNGSNPGKNGNGFGDVILNPSLQKRVKQLANATANTKLHQAPFRNMLFYGPPGTGKTMAARELARNSVCFIDSTLTKNAGTVAIPLML